MDADTINAIIKEGIIPLGAIQTLSYIADNERLTTNELIELTFFPKVTLIRYIRILEELNYIVIDTKHRPWSYELSDETKLAWKDK